MSIRPLVITFNCARELVNPAVFSNSILSQFPHAQPELLVFALEEIAPIAHSFLAGSFLSPYLDRINRSVELTARKWGERTYKNVLLRNLGMTALMIFVRDDINGSIVQLEVGGVGVGYQQMGNKGAVAAKVGLMNGNGEVTSFIFVASHLAPAEDAIERRNEDWKQIVQNLALRPVARGKTTNKASTSSTQSQEEQEPLLAAPAHSSEDISTGIYSSSTSTHDQLIGSHLIVAGDFNYRTANHPPRPYSRASFPHLSADEDSPQHYRNLLPCDQLSRERSENRTLHGLKEAEIDFPPTYKYSSATQKGILASNDIGVKTSDHGAAANPGSELPDWPWAGHRWPSWCDRILWLPMPGNDEITPLKYTSLSLMSTSDHQPVALHLSIPLKPVLLPPGAADLRNNPPFALDTGSAARRVMARRKEVVVGAAAFVATTTEGQAIIAALLVGAIGGWAIISNLL